MARPTLVAVSRLVAVALLALAPAAHAGAPASYAIKVTTTSFGRTAEVWQVRGGRIRVETFLRRRSVTVDRKLTAAEAARVQAFMRAFPLRKLRTRYVAPVRGEGSTTYEIRRGKERKTIFQYFQDQKDLTALWQLLRSIAAAKGADSRPSRP